MSGEARPLYGPRFESALAFSCALHFGQWRKGSGAPYVTHPMAVASLVGQFGGDEDQAIAALLHDVMEDCGVSRDTIATRYGEAVASIVVACTDTTERPKPPWRPRKEAHIAKVRGADPYTKLVIAADKLHNASCIVSDLHRRSIGEDVWDSFRPDKPDVLWYYAAMVEALGERWDHELHDELARVVEQLA